MVKIIEQNFICGGEKVTFGHILPTTSSKDPLSIFCPGYQTDIEVHQEWGIMLAERGHQVIIPSRYYSSFPQQVAIICGILDELNLKKARGIGHSAGCISLTDAAEVRDEIDQLLLLNPAGMIDDEWIGSLTYRFADETLTQMISPENRRKDKKPIRDKLNINFIKNLCRSLRDFIKAGLMVFPLSSARLAAKLKKLSARKMIKIIHTDNDRLFPMGPIRRLASKLSIKLRHYPGGHNQLIFDADKFSAIIHEELIT